MCLEFTNVLRVGVAQMLNCFGCEVSHAEVSFESAYGKRYAELELNQRRFWCLAVLLSIARQAESNAKSLLAQAPVVACL